MIRSTGGEKEIGILSNVDIRLQRHLADVVFSLASMSGTGGRPWFQTGAAKATDLRRCTQFSSHRRHVIHINLHGSSLLNEVDSQHQAVAPVFP